MADTDRGNVFVAAAWMVGISLVLFFLPLINGLIGGLVGGYKAGSPGRGFTAALIPALIVAGALWAIFALFGGPTIGFFAGATAGIIVLLADIGLLIGAPIGGYFAESRGPRRIAHT
jgi:hypothetical protein